MISCDVNLAATTAGGLIQRAKFEQCPERITLQTELQRIRARADFLKGSMYWKIVLRDAHTRMIFLQ
ncbi:hypothetical protein ASC90_21630 [Rhizobium sp. Root1220]|nr:hypothetical protein ASC90_21630 [Rhizobium sp. Root1220]